MTVNLARKDISRMRERHIFEATERLLSQAIVWDNHVCMPLHSEDHICNILGGNNLHVARGA